MTADRAESSLTFDLFTNLPDRDPAGMFCCWNALWNK